MNTFLTTDTKIDENYQISERRIHFIKPELFIEENKKILKKRFL